jgi:hypothetical protein
MSEGKILLEHVRGGLHFFQIKESKLFKRGGNYEKALFDSISYCNDQRIADQLRRQESDENRAVF